MSSISALNHVARPSYFAKCHDKYLTEMIKKWYMTAICSAQLGLYRISLKYETGLNCMTWQLTSQPPWWLNEPYIKNGGEGLISSDSTIPFSFAWVPCEEMRVQLCGGKGSRRSGFCHTRTHICTLTWLCLSTACTTGRAGEPTMHLGMPVKCGRLMLQHEGKNQTD